MTERSRKTTQTGNLPTRQNRHDTEIRVPASPEEQSDEMSIRSVFLETENRELRDALLRMEHRLTSVSDLFELAPIGYVTCDENDIILNANPAAETLLGTTQLHLSGTPFSRMIVRGYRREYRKHRRICRQNTGEAVTDLVLATADAGTIEVRLHSNRIADPSCQVTLFRSAIIDISEMKRLKTGHRVLSHDLRARLNVIHGYAQLLLDMPHAGDNGATRQYAREILKSSLLMIDMIAAWRPPQT